MLIRDIKGLEKARGEMSVVIMCRQGRKTTGGRGKLLKTGRKEDKETSASVSKDNEEQEPSW